MQGMAAVRRRPWSLPGVALAIGIATAGCTLIAPLPPTPADRLSAPQRLVREGRHAEAARAYAEIAQSGSPDSDYALLQSAEQWLAAQNLPEAHRALAQVTAQARVKLPTLRALVGAEIALADHDGGRAQSELSQIGPPPLSADAQKYWQLQGEAEFLTGHAQGGVRAFVERERWLTDAAEIRASRQELYERIRDAALHGVVQQAPANATPVVAGWLALGPVALELARNPLRASAALAAWRASYPMHPANDIVLTTIKTVLLATTDYPRRIALLLPLSGRGEPIGVAVRDGFISAYFEQDAASRPQVTIYDVAAQPVAAAYKQAIADGADFVVGPLTKEDVAAIVPLTAGRIPVLALNFLSGSAPVPRNLYEFALFPDDEARIAARRVIADGRPRGVAILPDGEWGDRVGAAFADELTRLGGAVLDVRRYEPTRVDFSDLITDILQVQTVKGEPSTHRTDAAFVFFGGSPSAARLLVPQLKFQYAGDVPVYSTSESYEPDPTANADIDSLRFPDMPWMISDDPVTSRIRSAVRNAWPGRTARRDRLYAFGFDAYRLVPALRSNYFGDGAEISGMTGRLRLDGDNHIRRDLDWAVIDNGMPRPL